MTRPEDAGGAVVFERPVPRWALPGVLFALAAGLALMGVSTWAAELGLALASALPFALASAGRDMGRLFCLSAPVVLPSLVLMWVGRRTGRAIITLDHLIVQPFGLRHLQLVTPLEDITARVPCPHGLRVRAPTVVEAIVELALPPLIPAAAEEVPRIHALLDQASQVPGRTTVSASGTVGHFGLFVLIAIPTLVVTGLVWLEGHIGWASLLTASAASGVCLSTLLTARHPSVRRVHMAPGAVSIAGTWASWSALRSLAVVGGTIALETEDDTRRVARLPSGPAGELARYARERLARDGRAGIVGDRLPAWVARRRRAVWVIAAVALLLALRAGPVEYFTREALVQSGAHGAGVFFAVYRVHDARPSLIVLCEESPDGLRMRTGILSSWIAPLGRDQDGPLRIEIDLARGVVRRNGVVHPIPRSSTVVHIRAAGVTCSSSDLSPAIPQFRRWGGDGVLYMHGSLEVLEEWLPGTTDAVLRAAIDGRTTTRCIDVGPGPRIAAHVAEGVLTSVALIDSAGGMRGGITSAPICGSCDHCIHHPGKLLRVTAQGELREGPLPTLEQVLEAIARVRRGAPVERATAEWAGDLWR